MILVGVERSEVAVDAAAGRVDQPRHAVAAQCLEDVLREVGALPEVDVRLRDRGGDVRIGREMEDHIDPGGGGHERVDVLDVAHDKLQPRVVS